MRFPLDSRICRLHAPHDIRIESETVDDPGPGEVLVAVGAGGICGSDLHYYHDGGFGPIRVQEPIILGHEAAGTVLEIGEGVTTLSPGTRVALNPSRPCHACKFCDEGLFNQCLNMRFRGSAMRFPHEQGLFRDRIVVEAAQCVPLAGGLTLSQAACAEPLAVCLHARRIAGDVAGKRVLVTGAGPIGALCCAVAAEGGAAEVVVTDLHDFPLKTATQMGATRSVNVARDWAELDAYAADKGHFDIVFECSAAAPAIASALAALRPRGILVQVGVGGETALPLNVIVGKEIAIRGTHRFHAEFAEAVAAIGEGRIDVRPIISASYPLEEAEAAFDAAGDRTRAVKVHLTFEDA